MEFKAEDRAKSFFGAFKRAADYLAVWDTQPRNPLTPEEAGTIGDAVNALDQVINDVLPEEEGVLEVRNFLALLIEQEVR